MKCYIEFEQYFETQFYGITDNVGEKNMAVARNLVVPAHMIIWRRLKHSNFLLNVVYCSKIEFVKIVNPSITTFL